MREGIVNDTICETLMLISLAIYHPSSVSNPYKMEWKHEWIRHIFSTSFNLLNDMWFRSRMEII